MHRQTSFNSQQQYEEPKQATQPSNQHHVVSQTLSPPPPVEPVQSDQSRPVHEKEEIQLLYVPLETLRQREQRQRFQQDHIPSQSQVRFVDQQNLSPQAHKQVQLKNIEQDFIQQALQAHKLQQQFQQQDYPQQQQQQYQPQMIYQPFDPRQFPNQQPLVLQASTRVPTTTSAPVRKRKPHQPPLAVYMGTDGQEDISIIDLLELLKEAKSITVQDYVSQDSPRIFVGPSNLQAPEGYVKFNLPYLSSFDKHTRVQGLHKVPFFVAPLNYKTPPGYSKIPFPSPHVGSVVINHRNEERKEEESVPHSNLLSDQLNEKNTQILYNEASTVASHNKNRQAFSTVFPLSSEEPVPYGPLPVNDEPKYSTTRTPLSTQAPILSTTPRTYLSTPEPQHLTVSPNVYNEQFSSTGHRFTTAVPSSSERVTFTPQFYTISTTNRNLQQQQQQQRITPTKQRPQINLSTPEEAYYDTTRNRSPNRYLPETNQPAVTTTQQYLIEQVTPRNELLKQQRHPQNYNTQSTVSNLSGFEAVKENVTQDQEYRPSYQTENSQNEYETRPERTRQRTEDKSRVVTENSYFNANIQPTNKQVQNQAYHIPVSQVTPQQVLQDSREKDRFNSNQYVLTLAQPIPQRDGFLQLAQPVGVTHRFVFNQDKQQNDQPTERQNVQEYVSPITQQQQYRLPTDLPISPQLPTLVNSLEDQAIRPLLAPLLLPTAEESEPQTYVEHTSPRVVSTTASSVPPSVTTETVVTRAPVVETTTPYRRLRGRQRATRPTNSPSTRTRVSSSTRSRRPYQEISKSTEVSDSTTRATLVRNRYTAQRERHPASTTESSKETIPYQQRFRTRGRPLKLEDEFAAFTSRTSTSTEKVVEIPTQYTVQPVQITPVSSESSTEDERKTYITTVNNEQPLAYLINGQHLINQNVQTGEEQPTIYILKEEVPVMHEYKEEKVQKEVEQPILENTRTTTAIDQSQFLVETTKPRTRSRSRDRSRSRTRVTTTAIPSTTRKEEKGSEESSEEFYGFFRQPNFKSPPKMEYKPSSELRTTLAPVQQSTFAPEYSDEQPTYYVSDTRSSTPRVYQIQAVEVPSEEDKTVYINSRVAVSSESSTEDVKPVTIRTTPSRRRYTTSSSQEIATERNSPERYFTTRPKPRQENQSQRTRIRGRIRRPTTSKPEKDVSTSSEENYSARSETSTTPKLRSRGKVHFRPPKGQDRSEEEDISENYPPSFLKAHSQERQERYQSRTQRPVFKLTIEPDSLEEQEGAYSTHPRSRSKELVKGEESQRYEKTVQGPNIIPLDKVDAEKSSALDDVKISDTTEFSDATSPISAKLVDDSSENSSNQAMEDVTDDNHSTTETSSEVDINEEVKQETTTISSTSTEYLPTTTRKKSRRRGVWRLVGQRPIDVFQSAESQNVGMVLVNDLLGDEKNFKIDKDRVAQMLTERPLDFSNQENQNDEQGDKFDVVTFVSTEKPVEKEESKTETTPDVTTIKEDEEISQVSEGVTQGPNEKDIEEAKKVMSFFDQFVSSLEKYSTTTEKTKKPDYSDFWKSKIIGTSTTTEVSHETEICYKGRCVKSQM